MSATTRRRPTCVRKITSPMPPRVWSLRRWDSEAWTRFLAGFVEAFPDLRLTVEDAVGEGDLVAQRTHFEGTHTGEFQGLPPTHKRVSSSGLELNRFVDGRVAEHWFQMDSLTLLQQLGLVVVPGPRLLPRVLAHQLRKLRRNAEQKGPIGRSGFRLDRTAASTVPWPRSRLRVIGGARLGAPDASLDDQQERTVAVLDLDRSEAGAGPLSRLRGPGRRGIYGDRSRGVPASWNFRVPRAF
jgi:predicted ester cyclase